MPRFHLGLTAAELAVFSRLTTPIKIQNFLDCFPINWEKRGETYMSPRRVLAARKMHCFEGALIAALALWLRGEPALLMDLKTKGDEDHVVALYKRHGYWGAISKSNHATLRWRDPVYQTPRELALSYFHEYFANSTKQKSLRSFSEPLNLKKCGAGWVTAEADLDELALALDRSKHHSIFPPKNARLIRPADTMECRAGRLVEWKKSHPRT